MSIFLWNARYGFPNERTGSQEEIDDIQEAYLEGQGDIEHIMSHIPHSTYEDEPRIINVVKKLVKSKTIASLPNGKRTSRTKRRRKHARSADNKRPSRRRKLPRSSEFGTSFMALAPRESVVVAKRRIRTTRPTCRRSFRSVPPTAVPAAS